MLRETELDRYSRHIQLPRIGVEGQEKLIRAKVLVVGAGGLGCAALSYMGAVGIGNIGIIDFDAVERTNFNRQILYSMDDVGLPKALQAADRISKSNPDICVKPFLEPFTPESAARILPEYDIVMDCTDQFSSRYQVSDACVRHGKPEVYGAVYHFEGQVTVFNYQNGPNLRDLQPEEPPKTGLPE